MGYIFKRRPKGGKTTLIRRCLRLASIKDLILGCSLGGSFDMEPMRAKMFAEFINTPYIFNPDGVNLGKRTIVYKGRDERPAGGWIPVNKDNISEALDSFSRPMDMMEFRNRRCEFQTVSGSAFVNLSLISSADLGSRWRISNDSTLIFKVQTEGLGEDSDVIMKVVVAAHNYSLVGSHRLRFDFPVGFVFEGCGYVAKKYTTPKTMEVKSKALDADTKKVQEELAAAIRECMVNVRLKPLDDFCDQDGVLKHESYNIGTFVKNYQTLICDCVSEVLNGDYDGAFVTQADAKRFKNAVRAKVQPLTQKLNAMRPVAEIDPYRTFDSSDSAAYVNSMGQIASITRKPMDIYLDCASTVFIESLASFLRGGSEGYGAMGISSELINTMNKTTFANVIFTYAVDPEDASDPLNKIGSYDGWVSGDISCDDYGEFAEFPLVAQSRWSGRSKMHCIGAMRVVEAENFDHVEVCFQLPSDKTFSLSSLTLLKDGVVVKVLPVSLCRREEGVITWAGVGRLNAATLEDGAEPQDDEAWVDAIVNFVLKHEKEVFNE